MIKKGLLSLVCFLLLMLVFGMGLNENYTLSFRLARLGVIIVFIFLIIYSFKIIVIQSSIKENFKNIAISVFSTLIILSILEGVFMFIPQSHGIGHTNASAVWFKNYWNPKNSLGFRDDDFRDNSSGLIFVGDSFTAGHGIKKVDARFSNIVKQQKSDKTVINIGKNGVDTKDEFNNLLRIIKTKRFSPETIILQYYGNDIDKTAMRSGVSFGGFQPYSGLSKLTSLIVKGTYLGNYLYWLFPRLDVDAGDYVSLIEEAFSNDEIVDKHFADLQNFISFTNQNSIELVVIIFPFLHDLEFSKKVYVDKVEKFLMEQQVKTINITNLAEELTFNERIVNVNDHHASVKLNKLLAEELLKLL